MGRYEKKTGHKSTNTNLKICAIVGTAVFLALFITVLRSYPNADADVPQKTDIRPEQLLTQLPEETPEPVPTPAYTEEELDWLARLICVEAGSKWLPDEFQLKVGSVALNRVADDRYPDNLWDVLHQERQYGPVLSGKWDEAVPDERTIENARWLLENGSILPPNVLFQDNEPHGDGIYETYEDSILGTTYFGYLDD